MLVTSGFFIQQFETIESESVEKDKLIDIYQSIEIE